MVIPELVQAAMKERTLEVDRFQRQYQARAQSKDGVSTRSSPGMRGLPHPEVSTSASREVRLLTTAACVLAAVMKEPGATLRDLARRCDKTERAVWQLIRELECAGLLRRQRQGRRNRYEVNLPAIERHLEVETAALLDAAVG